MDVKFNQLPPTATMAQEGQVLKEHRQSTNKAESDNVGQEIIDEYIPSQKQRNAVYTNHAKRHNAELIARLKRETEAAHNQLKELVGKLLKRQGTTYREALVHKNRITVDDAAQLEAKELIGDGGLLSPAKVSDRIVDFAIALAGGDKSKIGIIREAIDKGFREAAKALGGTLPEISHTTYNLIMEKLDNWLDED